MADMFYMSSLSFFDIQCIFNLSISVYFQSFNFSVFSIFHFQWMNFPTAPPIFIFLNQIIFSVFSIFQFQCIFNLNDSHSRLRREYTFIFSVFSIFQFQWMNFTTAPPIFIFLNQIIFSVFSFFHFQCIFNLSAVRKRTPSTRDCVYIQGSFCLLHEFDIPQRTRKKQ